VDGVVDALLHREDERLLAIDTRSRFVALTAGATCTGPADPAMDRRLKASLAVEIVFAGGERETLPTRTASADRTPQVSAHRRGGGCGVRRTLSAQRHGIPT
jgi:hypothetical protein